MGSRFLLSGLAGLSILTLVGCANIKTGVTVKNVTNARVTNTATNTTNNSINNVSNSINSGRKNTNSTSFAQSNQTTNSVSHSSASDNTNNSLAISSNRTNAPNSSKYVSETIPYSASQKKSIFNSAKEAGIPMPYVPSKMYFNHRSNNNKLTNVSKSNESLFMTFAGPLYITEATKKPSGAGVKTRNTQIQLPNGAQAQFVQIDSEGYKSDFVIFKTGNTYVTVRGLANKPFSLLQLEYIAAAMIPLK